MKSVGNEDVVQRRLQVLHVHIFFVAPLRARYMAKPGANQHQSRVAVRERSHHAGSADLTVQRRSITLLVRMRVQCSLGKSQ